MDKIDRLKIKNNFIILNLEDYNSETWVFIWGSTVFRINLESITIPTITFFIQQYFEKWVAKPKATVLR